MCIMFTEIVGIGRRTSYQIIVKTNKIQFSVYSCDNELMLYLEMVETAFQQYTIGGNMRKTEFE